MIEVRHLTKRYGQHLAVSDLSFTIDKGVIYGFLGPNGAGKSTTMNIITGCLGATEGQVHIDGHSIADDPMEAKKHIGYLPEQPPLYTDMTPVEYLHFVAKAKGISGKALVEQVISVMEKTRITDVAHRLIRNLSKGYKQRVGIAQALLGDPEVIILDEPTVGLDPAQIIEIRELIRELGQEHTIVLSSHILSEVQAVCDHIMIISKGKLVASDTPEKLTALFAGTTTIKLEIQGEQARIRAVLDQVDGAGDTVFTHSPEGTILCEVKQSGEADIRANLFQAFAEAGLPILEMQRIKASLEDVFLELTRSDASDEGNGKKQKGVKTRKAAKKADAPQDEEASEA